MSVSNYTAINAMVDIVSSPAKALDNIKDHTSWFWYPMLISIALAAAAFAYYYSWVDFDWVVDETIASIPAESRADSEDTIRSFMTPTTSIVSSVIAVVLFTLVMYSIQAVYLHLVAKLATNAEIRYGQWFNFSAWTAFVGVFAVLAMFVVVLMAESNQLSQGDLSPMSMNSLFIHASMGDDWFNWGNSLNLTHFWMLFLMSIGFSSWTGESMLKSSIIVVAPWALIFGIWALTI